MDDPGKATTPRPRRPWYSPLELLKRLVVYLVIGYITLCVYLYFMQNSLLYPRKELSREIGVEQASAFDLVPWDQPAGDGSAPQGYVRPDFSHPAPRGTLVVFHGNGGAAYHRTAYVEAFEQRGFRVFLYEYPGYGGRPGTPGETAIVPNARALIRDLDRAGYGPVYVWGESLGAGVAASVCADPGLPVHGLVLLTPWDTLTHVAQSYYPWIPVRFLLVDRYDSIANLQHFSHPICVVRSSQDEIIPPTCSIHLYEQLPQPKSVIVQEGYGHNDWPRTPDLHWWDDALDFIAPKIPR